MKKYIIVGCLLTLTLHVGCVAKRTPIKATQDPVAIELPKYVPTNLEVRDAIFAGIYDAGWRPQDRAPGLIYAKKRLNGETVTVEVDYTASSYFIKFTESTDEDYSKKSGNVPRLFTSWAKTLSESIDKKVALIGTEKPIHQVEAFPRIAPGLPGEPILLEREVQTAEAKRRAQREAEQNLKAQAADKATVPMSDEATDASIATKPQNMETSETSKASVDGALSPLPSTPEGSALAPVEASPATTTGVQERVLPENGASEKTAQKTETQPTKAEPTDNAPAVVHATPVILHVPAVQKVEAQSAEKSTQSVKSAEKLQASPQSSAPSLVSPSVPPKESAAPKSAPAKEPVPAKPVTIAPKIVEKFEAKEAVPAVKTPSQAETPAPQAVTSVRKEDLPEVGGASSSPTEVRGKVQETYLSAPEQY